MNSHDKTEFASVQTSELYRALSWQRALQDHADEIFDQSGYDSATQRINELKAELRRRGESL